MKKAIVGIAAVALGVCAYGAGNYADTVVYGAIRTATHGVSTVIFDSSGHNALCNSECLRRCGIIDGTRHVRPEHLKIFMDGCLETKTGATSKPYKSGVMYKSFWSVDRLIGITRECNAKGIVVHAHTMGDVAISDVTDAYVKGGDGKHRNCLVHIRHPRKEDFKRFADNNIACGTLEPRRADRPAMWTKSTVWQEAMKNDSQHGYKS